MLIYLNPGGMQCNMSPPQFPSYNKNPGILQQITTADIFHMLHGII